MRAGSGNTLSLWQATSADLPRYAPLRENANANVVIVGAGIAGLTCAYLLARSGKMITVLEEGVIGSGETARSTAHIANGLDDRYYELERLHGQDGARLAAESHTAAIAQIETIVRNEQIDCDFMRVPGYLISGAGREREELDREQAAAERAGVAITRIEDLRIGARTLGTALRFEHQAQFHPLRYIGGLARACTRLGVRIHTHTRVAGVEGGSKANAAIEGGLHVGADAIIVATNSPFNDRVVIHTKQAAYRTFVIALNLDMPVEPCLLWDTEDPYHYVRTWRDEAGETQWLIIGGEDHKTGQPDGEQNAFARLHAWARARLGVDDEVRYAWSGQILEPNDGLAFIGRNPADDDNVYIVTGDSGNGITHGTLAAPLLCDLIDARSNPWAQLYAPSRKQLHGLGEFVRENSNVAAQYAEHATPGDVDDASAIAPGSAAIVREGLHKRAAYRDFDGTLYVHSAVCTHLGCIVHWNSVERTWDCPCHGSRFDPLDGHVLNGPAPAPLSALDGGKE